MSDAPRRRLRHPNRLNRAHAGESLDPTLTRKGILAHPGSLFWGFAALLFFAYVFNVGGLQKWLDGFFGGVDTSVKSHNSEVATFVIAALPYLGVALGAVVLFFILSSMARGARSAGKRRKLGKRGEITLDEFIAQAEQRNVSKKVARECYRQLLPHYEHRQSVRLNDRFDGILQMSPVEVSDLYANVLRCVDRMRKVGDDGARLETVLDLMEAVEGAETRSLTQSKLHLRAEREANAPVRKRPSFAGRMKQTMIRTMIRKAAPAAAAQAQARPRDVSFVRPARLAVKELEMKPKVAADPAAAQRQG